MKMARVALTSLAGLVLALCAVAVLGVTAAWLWAGSDTSLATSLAQASRFLPPGHRLHAEDVKGTLRNGGHIGLLRWEHNGLVVEARQIELMWRPQALLDRRLQLDNVHVGQLVIDDRSPAKPAVLPADLGLPFQVDLAFLIDSVQWAGGAGIEASGLKGHYLFDGGRHSLRLDGGRFADGNYTAQGSLAARAPQWLEATVQGEVNAVVPGMTQPLPITATATIQGDLSGGAAAVISLKAGIHSSAMPGAVTADVAAQINPWAAQPVLGADVNFSSLNLAALWPGAPQTLLTGSAHVTPTSDKSWQARGNVTNRLSGPWDKNRLPVDSAQGSLRYSQGQWQVESVSTAVAGGQITATGRLAGSLSATGTGAGRIQWEASARLLNVNPAALHTQLEAVRIDGDVTAIWRDAGTDFDARLRPSTVQKAGTRLSGQQIRQANVSGRWAQSRLDLKNLHVQTSDARLQGDLAIQWPNKSMNGDLKLEIPGGAGLVQGHIGPAAGEGHFSLKLSDVARATHWLEGLPGAANLLAGFAVRGSGESTATWSGGWQGDGPTMQVHVKVPNAELLPPNRAAGSAYVFREVQADLTGAMGAFTVAILGKAQQGPRRLSLESRVTGRRSVVSAGSEWLFAMESLRVQAQDGLQAETWTARIREPVNLSWRLSATGSMMDIGAGKADVTGPAAGSASVSWQPAHWRNLGKTQEISTRGVVQGIPLTWIASLASGQIAQLGLRGDLTFDGEWNLQSAMTLRANASLRRRSGDIDVLAGNDSGHGVGQTSASVVTAGIREARLDMTMEDDDVKVVARWNSERAGVAQGELKTRVTAGTGGWQWPGTAPLSGVFKASFPQVSAWSMLAPAGWRIRGTLDAAVALGGTRSSPKWSGSLNADNLAVRSIADGIEFSNGRLRSSLVDQRLEIREFSLQGASVGGAGGSGGGSLVASGSAQWLPSGGETPTGRSGAQVDLAMQATALRVSARADRRLVVTGKVQATINDKRLSVRGALTVDQALFVLPDESTPTLGDDVIVRAPGRGVEPKVVAPVTRLVPDVAIALDMGPDFRVQGRGLTARLAGTLNLASSAATQGVPRLTGNLSTIGGSYKAYGQALNIEEGILRFTGPYDNPALDILAIRPNLAVRVGVQVSGTALLPRVRLYAEPDLAEAEKLAWLVLGRSGANGGAETAVLQQAAMALLGGNGKGLSAGLAAALGLDELSFRGANSNLDGTTSAAAVTLGKRLSSNIYVAYERSVAGTLGTVYVFYDLSRRFTLRAQTGEQSAIDLIFTVPYD